MLPCHIPRALQRLRLSLPLRLPLRPPFWLCVLVAFVLGREKAFAAEESALDAFSSETTRPWELSGSAVLETVYEDGTVKTKSTGAEEKDQRYVGKLANTGSLPLGQRILARANLTGLFRDGLRQDTLSTERKVVTREGAASGGLDISYRATPDVEVAGGLGILHLFEENRRIETLQLQSTTRAEAVQIYTPRFSVLKRSSLFAAGLFARIGSEKKRSYKRITEQQEDSGQEFAIVPTEVGLTGRFWLGGLSEITGEMAFVKLSSSEEKTEQLSPIHKDYFRLSMGMEHGLVPNTFVASGKLSHRTLSYADQGFVSFENIPKTKFELNFRLPSLPLSPGIGGAFEFAQDKQSTPELNSEFQWLAYTLQLSLGQTL